MTTYRFIPGNAFLAICYKNGEIQVIKKKILTFNEKYY